MGIVDFNFEFDSILCNCCKRKKSNSENSENVSGELIVESVSELSDMSVASVVQDQLEVLHNPFAGSTSQPKIPDGKVSTSLGFSLQNVKEYFNKPGFNTLHCILYAGQKSAFAIWDVDDSLKYKSSRDFDVLSFNDAGGYDISQLVALSDAQPTPGEGDIIQNDSYALHRVVSVGLQMKLLNPADENDGWWEAIRVNRPFDENEYYMTNVSGLSTGEEAAIVPDLKQMGLDEADMVNDPTYSTGILRDLDNVQFNLAGRLDYHDYRVMDAKHPVSFDGTSFDICTYNTITQLSRFTDEDVAREIINQGIDNSFDMIYIRLHCRARTSSSEEFNGSRLHCNVVSNQEVYFNSGTRDNRYHTPSYSIGEQTCALHMNARRANFKAAHLI